MSYCRFENTYKDFDDCSISLEENGLLGLSERERLYAKKMYELAKTYIAQFEAEEELANQNPDTI